MLPLRHHDVLDEACLCAKVRIIPQKLLIREQLVFQATYRVKPVYGRYDVPAFPRDRLGKLVLQLFDETFVYICGHRLLNVFFLYAYVADPEHDIAAVALDAEEAALLEFVVEAEDAPASRVEVAGVLEKVEADQVAEE